MLFLNHLFLFQTGNTHPYGYISLGLPKQTKICLCLSRKRGAIMSGHILYVFFIRYHILPSELVTGSTMADSPYGWSCFWFEPYPSIFPQTHLSLSCLIILLIMPPPFAGMFEVLPIIQWLQFSHPSSSVWPALHLYWTLNTLRFRIFELCTFRIMYIFYFTIIKSVAYICTL